MAEAFQKTESTPLCTKWYINDLANDMITV